MPEFVCVKPCWHEKHLYRLGERVDCEPSDLPKRKDGTVAHFEPLETKRRPGRPPKTEDPISHGGVDVRVNDKMIKK